MDSAHHFLGAIALVCVIIASGCDSVEESPPRSYDLHTEWYRQFSGAADINPYDLAADTAGNLYVTGEFEGTVDFDPGPGVHNLTSAGNTDIFLLKLSADGEFLWVKRFGGEGHDKGTAVHVDAEDHVLATGEFRDTVDFDPGPETRELTSGKYCDIFVSKMDVAGNLLWARQMGGVDGAGGDDVTVGPDNRVYVVGAFEGGIAPSEGFGNEAVSTDERLNGCFVCTLDGDGETSRVSLLKGYGVSCDGVSVDQHGNVYVSGSVMYSADFDPGTQLHEVSVGDSWHDYLVSLDETGKLRWVNLFRQIDGRGMPRQGVTATGDLYVVGYLTGRLFMNSTTEELLPDPKGERGFVLKLTSEGETIWAKTFGKFSRPMAINEADELLVGGHFSRKLVLDNDLSQHNREAPSISGFLAGLDSQGRPIMSRMEFGPDRYTRRIIGITTHGASNVYVTGTNRPRRAPGEDNESYFSTRAEPFVIKLKTVPRTQEVP